MVRHIVAWSFGDGFTAVENESNAKRIKQELEALKDIIEGIISIEVLVNPMDTSDSDLMLDSVLVSEEALKAYQVHPEHVKAAGFVRSVTKNRKCLDFAL
ncbi:MAG: Stress responsive alpha-beta barrel protein [Herbinix sp.]|jgi:hypothetical protein|nr:Stress responsive alpha-beta barrel protein [Herbinix sp.]